MLEDEWRTVRINMTELEKDFDYYLSLVDNDNKIIIITRDGKDFAAMLSLSEYDMLNAVTNP